MEPDTRSAAQDRCECGAPGDDISFDRSTCACGSMHYFCGQCGRQAESCSGDQPAATWLDPFREAEVWTTEQCAALLRVVEEADALLAALPPTVAYGGRLAQAVGELKRCV